MNVLTFESLRIALEDSSARVRIEDDIPTSCPSLRAYECLVDFWMDSAFTLAQISTGSLAVVPRESPQPSSHPILTGHPGGTSAVDSDV